MIRSPIPDPSFIVVGMFHVQQADTTYLSLFDLGSQVLLRDQSSANSLKPNHSGDYVILNGLFKLEIN